jgi:two-component system LytT family response regulator
MLRLAIVDDEASARASLRKALATLPMAIEIVGEAHNVTSAVELLDSARPQVVLLDVWLGDGTGFDVLERTKHEEVKIIFITAYDNYAVRAFQTGALHYLLKPSVRADLQNALERATTARPLLAEEVQNARRLLLDRISVRTTEGVHLFDPHEIIRCEGDGNYTRFYLTDGRHVIVSRTLKDFDTQLEPRGFLRVHRSHLVNPAFVRMFMNRDGGILLLDNGDEIPVSQRSKQDVLAMLGQQPG